MHINSDEVLIQRLLEVINEGQRDATYKLALLLALIDWVTTHIEGEEVPTSDLAEIVLGTYFRQTRKYPLTSEKSVQLRQGSNSNLRILRSAIDLADNNLGIGSIDRIRKLDPDGFVKARTEIEEALVKQPIPRLQIVGKTHIPFLYEWNWKPEKALSLIKKAGGDHLSLVPGVRAKLVVLGPMLRPIVQQFWVWDVAKWTKIETQESVLRKHLFGARRVSFPKKFVSALRELQGGKCFYCSASVKTGGAVDHFIPWSKYPNDAIQNLVLACSKCNSQKSDHLGSIDFLKKWISRPDAELEKVATDVGWESSPEKSRAIVANLYGALAEDSIVWSGNKPFAKIPQSDLDGISGMF